MISSGHEFPLSLGAGECGFATGNAPAALRQATCSSSCSFSGQVDDPPAQRLRSLQDLVPLIDSRIKEMAALSTHGELKVDNDRILSALLDSYQPELKDYESFRYFKESEIYCRNLIFSGEHFDLVLLCWNPGMASLIHDHPRSNCHMKVLEGGIFEDLYKDQGEGNQPKFLRRSELRTGLVAYVNDAMGLHSIGNLSSSVPAVSLHLYSPPIRHCKVVNQENGATEERHVSFHSEYGKIVDQV